MVQSPMIKTRKRTRRATIPSGWVVGFGVFLSLLWLAITGRLLGLVFLLPAVALHWTLPRHGRRRLVCGLWLAFALSPFCPVGMTFIDHPGPPRFVPLVMGFPDHDLIVASRRGEVVLGGCIVRGFEPKWVWVW